MSTVHFSQWAFPYKILYCTYLKWEDPNSVFSCMSHAVQVCWCWHISLLDHVVIAHQRDGNGTFAVTDSLGLQECILSSVTVVIGGIIEFASSSFRLLLHKFWMNNTRNDIYRPFHDATKQNGHTSLGTLLLGAVVVDPYIYKLRRCLIYNTNTNDCTFVHIQDCWSALL